MPGQTVSIYLDELTRGRLEQISVAEERKISQLGASALTLYALLPEEGRAALRRVQAFGTPEDLVNAGREISWVLLRAQYEVAERGAASTARAVGLPAGASEEGLLEYATALTRDTSPKSASDRRGKRRASGSSGTAS